MPDNDVLKQIENMEQAVALWVMAREHVRRAYNELEHAQAFLNTLVLDESSDTLGTAAYRRAKAALSLLDKIMCHMTHLEGRIGKELYGLKRLKKENKDA